MCDDSGKVLDIQLKKQFKFEADVNLYEFKGIRFSNRFIQTGRIHNNDEGRWQHPELTG